MKISGLINKEKINIRLDNIDVLYNMDGKYYFIDNEKLIEVIENLTEQIILQDFLFIPGKRIIKDSNDTNEDSGIMVDNENYTYYNCKHFINKNCVNRFKIKSHESGLLHYKIFVNRLVKNIHMMEEFEFLIATNNITPAMHHYFDS